MEELILDLRSLHEDTIEYEWGDCNQRAYITTAILGYIGKVIRVRITEIRPVVPAVIFLGEEADNE